MNNLMITIVSLVFFIHLIAHPVLAQSSESIDGANTVTPTADGYGFNVQLSGDFLFDFDDDSLTKGAKQSLAKILTLYREHQGFEILISGHTDSKGSISYNHDLSQRRANAVKRWFLKNGLSSRDLRTQAFGERQPVAPNSLEDADNPEGRALNRRVELETKTRNRVEVLPKARRAQVNRPKPVAPPQRPARAVPPKRIRAPKAKRPSTIIPPRYDRHGNKIRDGKRIDYDN